MKKIPSLFKRDYEGSRQVYDEVVPGSEWVIEGQGIATELVDGEPCLIEGGRLFRKLTVTGELVRDGKTPDGWKASAEGPSPKTGRWPGWVPVGLSAEDCHHREAVDLGEVYYTVSPKERIPMAGPFHSAPDGTYELVGPKICGNPYRLSCHKLVLHGLDRSRRVPRTFIGLRNFFAVCPIKGIVWHHSDGRMVKVKRKDFGFSWPASGETTEPIKKELADAQAAADLPESLPEEEREKKLDGAIGGES